MIPVNPIQSGIRPPLVLKSQKRAGMNRVNPHMPEIFLQRYCIKWVPGDPLKEMIN